MIETKWDRGRVLVIGGSQGALFSVDTAVRSAMKGGAGLVVACVPDNVVATLESRGGFYKIKGIGKYDSLNGFSDTVSDIASKSHCIVAGMGIEDNADHILSFFGKMLAEITIPCVVDADLINLICKHRELLSRRQNKHIAFVLTLNRHEAQNLFGSYKPNEQVVASVSKRFNTWIVLKGADTKIFSPEDGHHVHSSEKIPEMAVAGMGDVLSGLIGSFIAQGDDMLHAIQLALTIRKNAARYYLDKTGAKIVLPEDVIASIPHVW